MLEMRVVKTLLDYPPARDNLRTSLVFTTLLFVLTSIFWRLEMATQDYFYGISQEVFSNKEYWRIFSAVLIHKDIGHYASNAVAILALGYLLLGWFSWRVYPVGCFLLAGLTNAFALWTYEPEVRLLGASGLVYLMAGFWLMSYVLIQRSQRLGRRLIRAVGVTLGTLFPTTFEPAVSYRTHAIGFVIGLVFAAVWFYFNFNRIRGFEILVPVEPEGSEDLGEPREI
ncbi:MAG: rhomboid family intramembrane serine protease [Pseudomonadota bacterium]|nr:rhomboid family intramembrane serine protease [Pseudomonadota bacterium]